MLKEQNALNSLYKIWPWLELGTFYRKVLTDCKEQAKN